MDDEDRFCNNCGAHAVSDDGSSFGRQQEYIGTIRKCPSCGEEIPSFTAICPACGHELNSVNVPPAITDYSNQLRQMDFLIANSSSRSKVGWSNWNGAVKVLWVLCNIFWCCFPLIVYFIIKGAGLLTAPFTPEEESKVSLIANYSFPNDRETIVGALLFIKQQVAALAASKKSRTNIRWISIWKSKATQLYEMSKILVSNDKVADETYQEILKYEKESQNAFRVKIVLIISVFIILFIVTGVMNGIRSYNGGGSYNTPLPTISKDMNSDIKKGIDSYNIRNYVGKNAALIGIIENDVLVDTYGDGQLVLSFVTENGMLVDKDDINTRKQYRVINQNIKPDSKLAMVHERLSDGSFSSFVEYQNYDEIILYVAPIGQSFQPELVEPLPTLDWHKYHIRDYKGRNAASIGKTNINERLDEYGEATVRIEFSTEDGTYIDVTDNNDLKQYIVLDQNVKPNEELLIEYYKDSNGQEFELVDSQSYESIELIVKKLDKTIISKLPDLKNQVDDS